MKKRSGLLTVLLLLAAGAAAPPSTDGLHFALSKSLPEADSSVSALEEVRLWFTEAPQDNSVGIRLIDGAGDAVETGEVTADAEDVRVFSVAPESPLPAGGYTVAWRGVGDDGHPVTGTFSFSVTAQ